MFCRETDNRWARESGALSHDANRLQARVGGIGERHARVPAAEEVVDHRLVEPLAWEDDGDPGWVRGDLLGSDPPNGVVHPDVLECAEERVAWSVDRLQ